MIFDRTQADVDNAAAARKTLQDGGDLTSDIIEKIERGCLTVTVLNRVEDKESAIVQALNELGYDEKIETASWTTADVIYSSDFQRILKNADELKNIVNLKTLTTPKNMLTFNNMNTLEKILEDVGMFVDNMRETAIYSGEYYAGEV